jgi:hypothetical protein
MTEWSDSTKVGDSEILLQPIVEFTGRDLAIYGGLLGRHIVLLILLSPDHVTPMGHVFNSCLTEP